ncbi:hypothetical protein V6N13_067480 [Hibiscus sabdariffa]
MKTRNDHVDIFHDLLLPLDRVNSHPYPTEANGVVSWGNKVLNFEGVGLDFLQDIRDLNGRRPFPFQGTRKNREKSATDDDDDDDEEEEEEEEEEEDNIRFCRCFGCFGIKYVI